MKTQVHTHTHTTGWIQILETPPKSSSRSKPEEAVTSDVPIPIPAYTTEKGV